MLPQEEKLPRRFLMRERLLNAVEVYQAVLDGPSIKYPNFFWYDLYYQTNKVEISRIIRYFIEEVLKWDTQKIYDHLQKGTFEEYELGVLLKEYYDDNFFKLIDLAYPGVFKPWLFKHFELKYWSEHLARTAVKWLVLEKLKLSTISDIYSKLTVQHFTDNGMKGMLKRFYKGNATMAILQVYPSLNASLFRRCMVLPRDKK